MGVPIALENKKKKGDSSTSCSITFQYYFIGVTIFKSKSKNFFKRIPMPNILP